MTFNQWWTQFTGSKRRFPSDKANMALARYVWDAAMANVVRIENDLRTIKANLAALCPKPKDGESPDAWKDACPDNPADRDCLAQAWSAVLEAESVMKED